MTFSVPNPDVRPTGAEAGEFLEDVPVPGGDDTSGDHAPDDDPTQRPSGSPPLEPT
jgi:hypothetical protein